MITIEETKAFLGVTSTANDIMIQNFIDYTESEIEGYCDRVFDLATYNEVVRYDYSNFDLQINPELDLGHAPLKFFTKGFPIITFNSLKLDTDTIDSDNYIVNNELGEIKFFNVYDDSQDKLIANYIAGYSTIPGDLKMVALEGVKQKYQNFNTVNSGSRKVASKKVGDFSVSYESDLVGNYKRYISENKFILDGYKRWDL